MPAADVTLEHSYLRIYKTMKGRGNRELRNQAELVFQGFTTANVISRGLCYKTKCKLSHTRSVDLSIEVKLSRRHGGCPKI